MDLLAKQTLKQSSGAIMTHIEGEAMNYWMRKTKL